MRNFNALRREICRQGRVMGNFGIEVSMLSMVLTTSLDARKPLRNWRFGEVSMCRCD